MRRRFRLRLGWLLVFLAVLASCRGPAQPQRSYPLTGQILSIGQPRADGRRELSVKHQDIPGFMPAMSMAYFVKSPAMLDGLAPGDLVTATLVVKGEEIYLDTVKKTGHADLPPDARPVRAMEVMQPGELVPDDEMRDQQGHARRLSDWRGQALAVTFVYTSCPLPDFCPLLDRRFAELQRAISGDAALRDRAHLVSISFDPDHDTVDVIRAHAAARGADPATWSYLTGSPAAIDHVTSRFGVSVLREDAANARSITHNLRTAIVDARGRLLKVYSGNEWTAEAVMADLRRAR